MSHVFAKLINQYNFKNQITFLLLFNEYGEDNEIINQFELPITSIFTHNITQSEIENNNIQ